MEKIINKKETLSISNNTIDFIKDFTKKNNYFTVDVIENEKCFILLFDKNDDLRNQIKSNIQKNFELLPGLFSNSPGPSAISIINTKKAIISDNVFRNIYTFSYDSRNSSAIISNHRIIIHDKTHYIDYKINLAFIIFYGENFKRNKINSKLKYLIQNFNSMKND